MTSVDIKGLVTNVLLDDAGVIALVGSRVYTRLPPQPVFPLLIVRRLGGDVDFLGHVHSPRVAIQSWARKDQETVAYDVAAAAFDAVIGLVGTFSEGVVTGVTPLLDLIDLPDDPETGFPRCEFDIAVHCHPVPA